MKKYYFLFSEGSKVNQVISAIFINLPVFAYGTTIGWMSPMTLLLQSKDSPRGTPLTDLEVSWMASIAYLICIPSNLLIAYIGDKWGRKSALLFMSTTSAACWIVKLSSFGTWAFILARAFAGISMAGGYVTCPVYTKEISQDDVRGILGSMVVLFHTTGNLLLYVIGDVLSYNTVLWICLAIPTLHLVMFMMMPESPSYLVKNGKSEEAARVMAWLRCRNEDDSIVLKELEDIRREQNNDADSSKFALKAIVKDTMLLRAFRICMVIVLAREVCGAIPVLNFAGNIFEMASEGSGLVLTPNQQAMMLGAVQVAGAVLASGCVENTGRKMLLFITAAISGLSMCALASWFLAKQYQADAPDWIPIATLCLCIFCDASGFQPLSVIIMGEIFSFKYRGTVMAVTMATAAASDFLQLIFFKPLTNAVGVHVAFYFFGGVCLLAAIYILVVVPETKQRSLVEIYEALKTKKERIAGSERDKKNEA